MDWRVVAIFETHSYSACKYLLGHGCISFGFKQPGNIGQFMFKHSIFVLKFFIEDNFLLRLINQRRVTLQGLIKLSFKLEVFSLKPINRIDHG
jgi:hypothetical protein